VVCGLLTTLFMPLLACLNTLLGALDGNIGRCFLAAAQGRLKLGRLSDGNAKGGDIAPSFGGASRGVDRYVESPRSHSAMSMTLAHSALFLPSTRLNGRGPFIAGKQPDNYQLLSITNISTKGFT
jgi:hypothetical protein